MPSHGRIGGRKEAEHRGETLVLFGPGSHSLARSRIMWWMVLGGGLTFP